MVVVPHIMGLAIWSPRLDKCGNSVRGVKVCRRLVTKFSLHTFDKYVKYCPGCEPEKGETTYGNPEFDSVDEDNLS